MPLTRQQLIDGFRARLERRSSPRLHMTLIVAATGGVGFLTSFLFLHLGLTTLWLRYLCAVVLAYGGFLLLLRLWMTSRLAEVVDPGLLPTPGGGGGGAPVDVDVAGLGGRFGGAGASGKFELPAAAAVASPPVPAPPAAVADGASSALGQVAGSAADADELAVPLVIVVIVVLLVAALLLVSAYIIYAAPGLLAELSLDGALSAGLYRKLRGMEAPSWLETALRHTALPFAAVAVLVTACGWALQQYAPEAASLGEVLAHEASAATEP